MRPLQEQQLREHLTTLAIALDDMSDEPDDAAITNFHLDGIRTHALVTFTTIAAADRVRSSLHGKVWPDEPFARKPLWVDFIPDDKVQEWIDTESEGSGNKRDVRRWEVVYNTTDPTSVTATLEEITAPTGPRRQSSTFSTFSNNHGQGVPNAPTGPRSSRPSVQFDPYQRPPSNSFEPAQRTPPIPTGPRSSRPPLPPPRQPSYSSRPAPLTTDNNSTTQPKSKETKEPTASTAHLDATFPSTKTKPSLYYVPVSEELAKRRLANLADMTSRTWDAGRVMEREGGRMGFGERQLKRYMFEGERVVDGGPDFGSFARGGSGGRGRGRGGRGR
jgi:hypothetical protein